MAFVKLGDEVALLRRNDFRSLERVRFYDFDIDKSSW